jgi:hypothetical protein
MINIFLTFFYNIKLTVSPLELMVTGSPPTDPTTYPFQLQSTPNLSNFLLIPVGKYVYFITWPLRLITSPTFILNLPINSLCPLDTALVLTLDNFHLIFPPSALLPPQRKTGQKQPTVRWKNGGK